MTLDRALLAQRVEFKEDQLILLNEQRSTNFYLLVSGSVSVEARAAVYNISIQVLGPGDVFGWSSFLNRHDTLFQVRAREASTGLLRGFEVVCHMQRKSGVWLGPLFSPAEPGCRPREGDRIQAGTA